MPTKRPTSEADDGDALGRALRAVLAKERDPRARAWLRGLIRGDAPEKVKKSKPRKKAAAA